MKILSLNSLFIGLCVAIAACSATLNSEQQQTLDSFPPALREVVKAEPPHQQREFLTMPQQQRDAIVSEWENREQAMQRFTPAERMIISGLSQQDADKFFALAPAEQEQFLADTVKRNTEALISCMTMTHRRFGD